MKQRILSMILLAAMLASTVACGGESGSTETTAASGDTTSTATDTTDYLGNYVGTDLGGATFTIGVLTHSQYPNYAGEEANGDTVNDTQYKRDSYIEDTYNVTIEYMPYDDEGKLTSAVNSQVLSGDKVMTCVESSMIGTVCKFSTEGILRNLMEVDGLEADAEWWSQSFNREFTINSKLFSLYGPMVFAYYYSPRLVAFNLRLAEEYNLGNLYDVVNDGKWTLDYMAETMKTVKADLDGDGEYGDDDMWGASVDEYSAAGFYISAGGTQISIDADGVPSFRFDDERNFEIIEKVASIIGNADMTQKAEPLANRSGSYNIIDKCYTFKNGHALYFGYGAQAIALYLRDMNDDYGLLPVPKFDEAQEEYITFGNGYVPGFVAIPANVENDKLVSTMLNIMGYMSRRDLQPTITDVLLKGKAARDAQSMDMIDLIYSDVVLDINAAYNFASSFTLLRDITMGKREGFASGWASLKESAQTSLNELFEAFAQ